MNTREHPNVFIAMEDLYSPTYNCVHPYILRMKEGKIAEDEFLYPVYGIVFHKLESFVLAQSLLYLSRVNF